MQKIHQLIADLDELIQSYLLQMPYVLFAKPHKKQIEIFSTLQACMMQSEQSEDV